MVAPSFNIVFVDLVVKAAMRNVPADCGITLVGIQL